MKKKLLIIAAIAAIAITSVCLSACKGGTEGMTISDTLSYNQYMLYSGENDEFRVSVTGVKKEELFISDGKIGNLVDSVKVTLRPVSAAMLDNEYSYRVKGELGSVEGKLSKDGFGVTFSSELTGLSEIGEIECAVIMYSDKSVDIPLTNRISAQVDSAKALEIAYNQFKDEIDVALKEGTFNRESYVKLVHNDNAADSGYYWFVSFIAAKDDYWAVLIDSKDGTVVSSRKSGGSAQNDAA